MVGLERGWRVWRRKTPELRRLGMNSRNSSTPPAGLDRDESGAAGGPPSGEHSKGPQAGGQPGRKGTGLVPAATPDRTETLAPPGECSGCGGDLTNAADAGELGAGVGLLPAVMEKVHYLLPRRRCGCGKITTAVPPFGAVAQRDLRCRISILSPAIYPSA
jgi:hypothetical protein